MGSHPRIVFISTLLSTPSTDMSAVIALALGAVAGVAAAETQDELTADPRLFFGNVTANLLPVNVTLAAYGAAIVLGGSILGLAIYFLATQAKQYRTGYNYGYGYGNDQYSHHGPHGHHASSRVDTDTGDVLGMVGSALDNYQKVEDEEEENDFRVRRVK